MINGISNLNPIILELLKNRGVCEEADVLEFLSDSPKKTYDPFLFDGMQDAVEMIKTHLEKKSRICIYGDYDADGVTSVTLLMTAFGKVTHNLTYYIPSRFDEGYGLNMEAVERIHRDGTDLIITVDCGSVSFEEVRFAKELGMDIIVTDHHSITDKKADTILINPKLPGGHYPFDGLAGVGVAFKLTQALVRSGILEKSIFHEVLDLVAIGTIGDIVPLADENRTLVKFGLRAINTTKREGLCRLIDAVGIKKGGVKSDNVAFILVPHINAAGRLEDASLGVKLLLEDEVLAGSVLSKRWDGSRAAKEELATKLVECNRRRKTVQEETYNLCLDMIDEENIDDVIIVKPDGAHEGITGIVAGKIKDRFYRPAIVVTPLADQPDVLKGTSRSIEGINLYELLKTTEDLFLKFGGHAGACGFSLRQGDLDSFRQRILAQTARLVSEDSSIFTRKTEAELELRLSDATPQLASQLELLAPFGAANKEPEFEFRNVRLDRINFMGQEKTHVRFCINQGKDSLSCVMFSKARDFSYMLFEGSLADVTAHLELSEWNGRERLQLVVSNMVPV